MAREDTIALLNSIGCEAQAADLASIRFAEQVIAGERRRIAAWIRDRQPISGLARRIERGEHY